MRLSRAVLPVIGLLLASCARGPGAAFVAGPFAEERCPTSAPSHETCYVATVENAGGASGRATCWVSMYKKPNGAGVVDGDRVESEEAAPGEKVEVHLTMPKSTRGYTVNVGCTPGMSS